MRITYFLVVLLIVSISHTDGGIRADFHREVPSKQHLLSILDKGYSGNPTIILAYQGLCESLMAEFLFLPTSKMSSFKKGNKKVENAIAKDTENCELRYIRLMIQLNAPRFLNYNDEISQDLEYFAETLHHQAIAAHWKLTFIDNLLLGKHLNANQKNQLLTLKEQYNATSSRSTGR